MALWARALLNYLPIYLFLEVLGLELIALYLLDWHCTT
jgi:hypothetical protein